MIHTMTANEIARMEADNDAFLVIAPIIEDLDKLAKSLEDALEITRRTLTHQNSIKKQTASTNGPSGSLQDVGLKITRLSIVNRWHKNKRSQINQKTANRKTSRWKHVISAKLFKRKDNKAFIIMKNYKKNVGTFKFIADATHSGIAYIVATTRRWHGSCRCRSKTPGRFTTASKKSVPTYCEQTESILIFFRPEQTMERYITKKSTRPSWIHRQ